MLGENDGKCFICGCGGRLDTHHIFGGPNRRLSDEDGLIVKLCRECHELVHGWDGSLRALLHEAGQREYEKTHTREEFMARYGKNYIYDDELPFEPEISMDDDFGMADATEVIGHDE